VEAVFEERERERERERKKRRGEVERESVELIFFFRFFAARRCIASLQGLPAERIAFSLKAGGVRTLFFLFSPSRRLATDLASAFTERRRR
jgi:hypothetical protein